jgi:hypothetical protein
MKHTTIQQAATFAAKHFPNDREKQAQLVNAINHKLNTTPVVIYTVSIRKSGDSKDYTDVNGAAQAFRDAKAEDRPMLIRTERHPDGRESASTPGQTSYTEKEGHREYGKWIGGNDEALKRAYAATTTPAHERSATAPSREPSR